MLIVLQSCLNSELSYMPAEDDSDAGRGASKKWRESLRVGEGGRKTSLGTWIENKCTAADTGNAHELCCLCMLPATAHNCVLSNSF